MAKEIGVDIIFVLADAQFRLWPVVGATIWHDEPIGVKS